MTKQPGSPRRVLRYALIGIVVAVIAVIALIDVRYGVLLPTLRAKPDIALDKSAVQVVVDPDAIGPLLPSAAAPVLPVPGWLLHFFIPYEAGGVGVVDFDAETIALTGYLNARRLAPFIAREAAKVDLKRQAPHIRWNGPAYEARPGLLIFDGTIPLDPDAEESFGYMWDQGMTPPPLAMEGGHFVEAVLDNRRGHAYLAFASFVRAYDIDLSENQHEIELASLQFVREARFTMDYLPPDSFEMRLVLEITREGIDKLGVVNLKVAIEEAIQKLGHEWEKKYDISLTGESRWEETSIVYEYELESARKWLGLIRDGELKSK